MSLWPSSNIPTAWTTSFTVDTGNVARNFIVLNAVEGRYMRTLTINHYWSLLDGSANEFYQIYLLLIQDATGGRTSQFPGAIAWSGVSVDVFGQPALITTALTLTLIKFTWLGVGNGYLAEV